MEADKHRGRVYCAHDSQQTLTDAELVQLAREGEGYAFNLLMERYQVMASYIALHMISNEETAHDLVQEAMLQAFLSLDPSGRFWLKCRLAWLSWMLGLD